MKMLEYTNNFQQVTNNSKSYEIWGFAPQHIEPGVPAAPANVL